MNTKRICKILVASLAATLVLAFAAGFSACGEETGGSDLEARMEELEAKLEESEKKVGELETNLEETASEPDDAKAKIDELESGGGTSSENPSAQSSSGDFLYTAFYDGSGYMVAGIGDWYGAELVIPSEHNGLTVMAIGYEAFYNDGYTFDEDYFLEKGKFGWLYSYTFIKTVTIPDSVNIINEGAFKYCNGIEAVVIGTGVMLIDDEAFHGCTSLATVYYAGTAEEWDNVYIDIDNDPLTSAAIYYYSETEPAYEGNFWHYVDGAATVWGE